MVQGMRNLLIKRAQSAIESGKEVYVTAEGYNAEIRAVTIDQDEVFASLENEGTVWLIRIDALIGIRIAEPWNPAAFLR